MSNGKLLPAQVLQMLDVEHKKSNQEVIIDHLITEEGAVELTPKQQQLLERWQKADDLLRKYNTREVVSVLCKIFGGEGKTYSVATAWRDIEDARHVFGSTRKPSKVWRLDDHLDRIDELIKYWMKKDGKIAQKLIDSYTYALSLKKDEGKQQPIPTAIIFNISTSDGAHMLGNDFTSGDAQEVAAAALLEKGLGEDYLDFEDVTIKSP